ncbi:hypothetical protein ACJJTC_016422 [Scirpophaga incertulas]
MSETMVAVYEHNLRGDSNWTKEKVLANCRLAFRKSRMGSSQSVMVLACSPELRKTLKCAQYGHNDKKCRQEATTCLRRGVLGHKGAECKAESPRCATCHRFGQKGAETHVTGARDCPARLHAERRMVESTAY